MDFKGFYDEIIFDVDRPILKSYTGKQGDTKSRGLYVTVTQKNTVIEDLTGLSMRFFYEKPDKTRGFIDGVVDGSKFRIDYTNQVYAVPGVVKAELRLMGADEEIITAKTFKILVDSSIADGSIVSENERGILDRAFELAEDIIPRLELLDVELLEDVQNKMLQGQLKVAKVEKELNDYKATMQQINIHQSPTQKASGYDIVSLPKNAAEGQISVTIKGKTVTQMLKNGNFKNGTTDWAVQNATNFTVTNGIAQFTVTAQGGRLWQYVNVIQGHVYYITAWVKADSNLVFIDIAGVGKKYHSGSGNWERLSNKATWSTTSGSYPFGVRDERTSGWAPIQVTNCFVIDLTAHGLENLSLAELDAMFPYYIDYGTKSTISAFRIRSVSEDESQESVVYVLAKDDEGNIEELRSLPNGVKDEVNVVEGKYTKRVSEDIILNGELNWKVSSTDSTGTTTNVSLSSIGMSGVPDGTYICGVAKDGMIYSSAFPSGSIGRVAISSSLFIRIPIANATVNDVKNYFASNPVTLNYQLAEPVEMPIQVSGSIVSYPSGTIYIERILPDAGVYTDKITILHQGAPIKRLDRLSKVDFYTGVETELDVSEAVIAEDKLSFTHPELNTGDIVFFEYEYDVESTDGEAEVEFYDSRYVVKDTETGKFYKWNIVVANGQPSIELVEV